MKQRRSNYRQRCLLLLATGSILVVLLWKQRLSTSLGLWQAREELAARLAGPDDRSQRIDALRTQLARMDAALGDPELAVDEVWRSALSYAAEGREGARLHEVEEEVVVSGGGKAHHVLPMTMQGGFGSLLRMANGLVTEVREARIASLRFHAERDPVTRKRMLLLTLYLQKTTNDNG